MIEAVYFGFMFAMFALCSYVVFTSFKDHFDKK